MRVLGVLKMGFGYRHFWCRSMVVSATTRAMGDDVDLLDCPWVVPLSKMERIQVEHSWVDGFACGFVIQSTSSIVADGWRSLRGRLMATVTNGAAVGNGRGF